MRVYANPDGSIMAAVRSVVFGAPASVSTFHASRAAAVLDLDEATNTVTADALETDSGTFRLAAGVLSRNGTPVVIAPPGQHIQDRDQIQQALGQLDTFLQNLDAGQNLTAAQVQQAIRFLLRFARYVLRWILRHG